MMISNDLPILKQFVVNGQLFVYDTYKNIVIKVNKDVFNEIHRLKKVGNNAFLNEKNTDSHAYAAVVQLINKGYFKANYVESICHRDTSALYDIVQGNVSDLTLQLSRDCNFNCRYCEFAHDNHAYRNHEKNNMSFELAQKCVDFLYEHSGDAPCITISFYGGEPLLNFDVLKKVVVYTENLFQTKKVTYTFTTNGSLLNLDVINFVVKHNFIISISFDGPKKIQNKHRKFALNGYDTYELVCNNIKLFQRLYKNYFDEHVLILPVRFEDESAEYISSFITNSLHVVKDKITIRDAVLQGIDYVHSSDVFTINKLNTNKVPIDPTIRTMLRDRLADKRPISTQWHHNGPCIPSTKTLFIDVNGNFYPCEKCVEVECLSIGNIYDGFNYHNMDLLMNIGMISEKECKSCWAMRFCNLCAIDCYDTDVKNISKERKLIECDNQRLQALTFLKEEIASRQSMSDDL